MVRKSSSKLKDEESQLLKQMNDKIDLLAKIIDDLNLKIEFLNNQIENERNLKAKTISTSRIKEKSIEINLINKRNRRREDVVDNLLKIDIDNLDNQQIDYYFNALTICDSRNEKSKSITSLKSPTSPDTKHQPNVIDNRAKNVSIRSHDSNNNPNGDEFNSKSKSEVDKIKLDCKITQDYPRKSIISGTKLVEKSSSKSKVVNFDSTESTLISKRPTLNIKKSDSKVFYSNDEINKLSFASKRNLWERRSFKV